MKRKLNFENDYEPVYHDELERDWDESYEPDYPDTDSWYEEQYQIEDF